MMSEEDATENLSVYSGVTEQYWPLDDIASETAIQKRKPTHAIKPAHPKTAGFNTLLHGI